jgi:hypothetical protein
LSNYKFSYECHALPQTVRLVRRIALPGKVRVLMIVKGGGRQ